MGRQRSQRDGASGRPGRAEACADREYAERGTPHGARARAARTRRNWHSKRPNLQAYVSSFTVHNEQLARCVIGCPRVRRHRLGRENSRDDALVGLEALVALAALAGVADHDQHEHALEHARLEHEQALEHQQRQHVDAMQQQLRDHSNAMDVMLQAHAAALDQMKELHASEVMQLQHSTASSLPTQQWEQERGQLLGSLEELKQQATAAEEAHQTAATAHAAAAQELADCQAALAVERAAVQQSSAMLEALALQADSERVMHLQIVAERDHLMSEVTALREQVQALVAAAAASAAQVAQRWPGPGSASEAPAAAEANAELLALLDRFKSAVARSQGPELLSAAKAVAVAVRARIDTTSVFERDQHSQLSWSQRELIDVLQQSALDRLAVLVGIARDVMLGVLLPTDAGAEVANVAAALSQYMEQLWVTTRVADGAPTAPQLKTLLDVRALAVTHAAQRVIALIVAAAPASQLTAAVGGVVDAVQPLTAVVQRLEAPTVPLAVSLAARAVVQPLEEASQRLAACEAAEDAMTNVHGVVRLVRQLATATNPLTTLVR